ncbi:peptidylprolyl isomerase [Hydrogenophaga sp. 5NK40-0174]|uniref:peptidylprolyl isomerase n=1 Tax=Hydrogenophaga sp. 5NK40-0174 TaxID=3127649 RepID=UPI00333EC1C2
MTPIASGALALSLALCLSMPAPVMAQKLKATPKLQLPVDTLPKGVEDAQTADYIVAVVNTEPVTNHEVRQRLVQIVRKAQEQGKASQLPAPDILAKEVLEQLINERAQIQYATERGMRVDEVTLDDAEARVAANNKLSVSAFRERLKAEGIDLAQFRRELSQQVLLQQVQEREVDARVRIEESDIDALLRRQGGNDLGKLTLDLSHVLVMVPEGASEDVRAERKARAQAVADKARSGVPFEDLAREFSDAPEGARGGGFGPRTADRLPSLFVEATRGLQRGEIAGPLASPAGFHVLKVNDKQQGSGGISVVQTHPRHILLRVEGKTTEASAIQRLTQLREDILAGKTSFEAAAREVSQDGSAANGGDLGWVGQGQFVPEFESVMNTLPLEQISEPVVSRFGVHLIRVDGRRERELDQSQQRLMARNMLKNDRAQEALLTWAQDVRSRAYVEYREAPRP